MLACFTGAWTPPAMRANRTHGELFNRHDIFDTTKWWPASTFGQLTQRTTTRTVHQIGCWVGSRGCSYVMSEANNPSPAGNQATELQTWSVTSLKQLFQDILKRPNFLHLPRGMIHYDRTVNTEAVKTTSDKHIGVLEWSGGGNVWIRQRLESKCIIIKFKVCSHR
jgi:hypothetical protein